MDEAGIQHFSLTDRTGKSHHYEVILHDGVPGWKLYQRVTGLLAPIVGSGLLAVAASGKGLDIDIEALASSEGIGASLRGVVLGFTPVLVNDLLTHVVRDGKQMSDEAQRSKAFRANYDEQAMALMKVMSVNGFFPASNLIEQLASVAKKAVDEVLDGDEKSSSTPPDGG